MPHTEKSQFGFDVLGCIYSRVHISLDEVVSKILKKPSIVQKKMIPHMKAKVVFIAKKNQNQNGRLKKACFPAPTIVNIF